MSEDEVQAQAQAQPQAPAAPLVIPKSAPLPPGANQVFRLLDRGPMLWGLPVKAAGMIMGGTSLGFFVLKPIFGWPVAGPWLLLGAATWAALGFINAQDKIFIPLMMLRFSVKLHPRVTSFTRGTRKLIVLE